MGSIPIARSCFNEATSSIAAVAQSVECVLGKDEVMGSNPISSFGDCWREVVSRVGRRFWVFFERFVDRRR